MAVFGGKSVFTDTPVRLFGDFFAFEETLRDGIFIAVGDVNGDGFGDLVTGGGPGGGPRVQIISGKLAKESSPDSAINTPLANFFGGDPNSRGGIRVAAKFLDSDNKSDVIVGAGEAAGSRVTAYLGKDLQPTATPTEFFGFDALPGFTKGVFVG